MAFIVLGKADLISSVTEGRRTKAAFDYKHRRNTSLKRNLTQNIRKVINSKLE